MEPEEQQETEAFSPPTKNPAAPLVTLYVLIPPSPLFAAHWSFFLPALLEYDPISERYEESNIGRRIHVSGDRLNGFSLEIVRGYDIRKHRSVGTRRLPIALMPDSYLPERDESPNGPSHRRMKDEDEGGGYVDNDPLDDFERVCVEVDAPGPSLKSVQTGSQVGENKGRKKKAEVKDCQWWVRKVVELAMSRGMLSPLPVMNGGGCRGPLEMTKALPVH